MLCVIAVARIVWPVSATAAPLCQTQPQRALHLHISKRKVAMALKGVFRYLQLNQMPRLGSFRKMMPAKFSVDHMNGPSAWDPPRRISAAAGPRNYGRVRIKGILVGLLWGVWLVPGRAEPLDPTISSLLESHCLDCHDAATTKGELDLERFDSLDDIARDPRTWENVLHQVGDGEMPPKDKKPFSSDERKQFMDAVQNMLNGIALASAGDPGAVVLRRLSNHEYTYTIRDLTGVETLDPAKEFPVDGAAGEGFTNAGAGLMMSPGLLTKYLDAAKSIADHAVFTPEGMRWSTSTSPQDWTNEALAQIRALYARYTEVTEGTVTVQQGIQLDTGTGNGKLPLGRYLDALQGRGPSAGLSEKYLSILGDAMTAAEPSLLLDPLRAKFREETLGVEDIEPWRRVLWRFASVGHIGKENGPKAWQEPVSPLVSRHEMRLKLSGEGERTLYLWSGNAGDGAEGDDVVWENPRLVIKGSPDLAIQDLPALIDHLESERTKIIAGTEACLAALVSGTAGDVDPGQLAAWRDYLGYRSTKLEPLLKDQLKSASGYDFIKGWSGKDALSVLANSSDATVRVPGVMKGHSVATHPSPTRASVIAWQCPAPGAYRVSGDISHAHSECGNGIAWTLEVRRGQASEVLANGISEGAKVLAFGPSENVRLESGQAFALIIGPRDGNHSCDLTAVNLSVEDDTAEWDLAGDVSPNILDGNPHGPWHFFSQPATLQAAPEIPQAIAAWRENPSAELAVRVRQHLKREFPLGSPLLSRAARAFRSTKSETALKATAPSVIEVVIPAGLAKGAEFVVTGRLASPASSGSVQMQVLTQRPDANAADLLPGMANSKLKNGHWSDNNLVTSHSAPIIVNDSSVARERFESAFAEFRALFPIALCYSRIVPVDEVVTLRLYHREDEALKRLILSEDEIRQLDRTWNELIFVSEAPLKQVDAFEQLWQFATQDAKPSAFEPLRQPIFAAAEKFRKQQQSAEAEHRRAALDFAACAWRRPLTQKEIASLESFSPRLTLVRILTSPAFLYRGEQPPDQTGPVSQHELATRLSYFLWSSTPDHELLAKAAAGTLRDSDVLSAQVRRMTADAKIRRLATEFGAQWLHVRDLESLEEKSERHFPTFVGLRSAMQEETVRFFIDLFQNDRSLLSLLNADHSFVDAGLADHYGLEFEGEGWQRIDGLQTAGRGGILGFASTLAKHSGASRTSPILRGNWVSEVLLGEKLPKPPKDVPVLPDEVPSGLTERQMIERHSSDPSCARCHAKIDPLGFALEGFDAIGRARTEQDTRALLADGTSFEGLAGLRNYLLEERREDFLRQFCRKLLGYALGRSVQLSDKPLIDAMLDELESNQYRASIPLEMIVQSPQFRNARGQERLAERTFTESHHEKSLLQPSSVSPRSRGDHGVAVA